jgi:tripartite-type tricarboxylate transporter receptor subunit TctC
MMWTVGSRKTSVHYQLAPRIAVPMAVRVLLQSFMRLILSAVTALLIASASPALAEEAWPQHPVTIVVPFQAGGSADLLARIAAQQLQAELGTPFVVENRSGAGGSVGTSYVAKADPDGYTFLLGTFSGIVLNGLVYSKLPYDAERDLRPVALLVRMPNLLVVNQKVPVKTVPELIDYIKANDGKLNYGSSGVGTSSHLSVVLLGLATGTHMTHVPFRSTTDEVTSLINGSIDLAIDSMTTLWPQAQSGAIRALAVSTATRSVSAPDLPTIAETIKGYAVPSWQGLFAPAGTPKAIIDKVAAALKQSFEKPEVVDALTKLGGDPALMGPDEFGVYIKEESPKWRDAVKAAGVHID